MHDMLHTHPPSDAHTPISATFLHEGHPTSCTGTDTGSYNVNHNVETISRSTGLIDSVKIVMSHLQMMQVV